MNFVGTAWFFFFFYYYYLQYMDLYFALESQLD